MRLAIDDTALISALHNGEPGAYEAVYYHYVAALRYFVEQLVKDPHVAEDITAEAFTRTFRKHADFDNLFKLKSFLYTTASNASIDFLRQQKTKAKAIEEISYRSKGEMEDVELAYIEAEVAAAIQTAIDALPPQPRKVIQMAFIEGKKLPEIAEAMQLSYNTVQNYRGRGLELLRMQLIKNKLLSPFALILALSILEQP